MATVKERIGVYSCWSCNYEVIVKRSTSGKLSAPCPNCDFPHYANEGTEHAKILLAKTRLDKKPEPEPKAAPKPAPKAEPKPAEPAAAPKRSNNPFAPGA